MIDDKKAQTEQKTTLDKKLEHWPKTTKAIETTHTDAKTGIGKMLTEGEQIVINADQSRMMPGGSIATPNSIYVTNKRIIFRNPRMWGLKVDLMDYAYSDLANVELHKGIFTTANSQIQFGKSEAASGFKRNCRRVVRCHKKRHAR